MTTFPKVQGDVKDFIVVVLGGVEDLLTLVSVEAYVWKPHVDAVTLPASLVDAVARTIRVELGDETGWLATQATPYGWSIKYRATFGDGTKLTWPAGPPDVISVSAQKRSA
jgi:hypothetical protein